MASKLNRAQIEACIKSVKKWKDHFGNNYFSNQTSAWSPFEVIAKEKALEFGWPAVQCAAVSGEEVTLDKALEYQDSIQTEWEIFNDFGLNESDFYYLKLGGKSGRKKLIEFFEHLLKENSVD